jgi:hypothetical protein
MSNTRYCSISYSLYRSDARLTVAEFHDRSRSDLRVADIRKEKSEGCRIAGADDGFRRLIVADRRGRTTIQTGFAPLL